MWADRGISWPTVAVVAIAILLVSSKSWASEQDYPHNVPRSIEWMRGVPRGCRLISFDLKDGSAAPAPRTGVEIVWTRPTSGERHESTALIKDVEVLEVEWLQDVQGNRPVVRATAALTPHQAQQVQLAAIHGGLLLKEIQIRPRVGVPDPGAWKVAAVVDRTEMIETRVGASIGQADLQRPTLADGTVAERSASCGIIAVPIEIGLHQ